MAGFSDPPQFLLLQQRDARSQLGAQSVLFLFLLAPGLCPFPKDPNCPLLTLFARAVGFLLPGLCPKELPNLPLSFPVTGSAHTVALWEMLAGQWEEAAMVCTLAN